MKGTYNVKCFKENGDLRWEYPINNVVTILGRNTILDAAFSEHTLLISYMGLISAKKFKSLPKETDTMFSHPTWVEAGLKNNFPLIRNNLRTKIEWLPADNSYKNIKDVLIPIGKKGGLVRGCFIVTGTGASIKIEDTTGILLSAGLFNYGGRTTKALDYLSVSYSICL